MSKENILNVFQFLHISEILENIFEMLLFFIKQQKHKRFLRYI